MSLPLPVDTCLTIYGINECGYTQDAKILADKRDIPFKFYNVAKYPNYREKLKITQKTVPVIYWNGKLIGGYDDLKKLTDDGTIPCFNC